MAGLKEDILNKKYPLVFDASWSPHGYAWGDLELLGWAEKHIERSGYTTADVYWEYTGPNGIDLNGRIMYTGDVTEKIEVDYG